MKTTKEIWDICKNCVFADTDCTGGLYCSEEFFKANKTKKNVKLKIKEYELRNS